MYYYKTICILFIILTTAIFNNGEAQDLDTLPKLLPSYTEDFIDYSTNPSMCFDKVFIDKAGQMWLTPCTGTLTGLHLFRFDGYEFKAIRGQLDNLPTNTKFFLMDKKQRLVGYAYEKDNPQIVAYSLQANELITYPIPFSGMGGHPKMFLDKNDALNLYFNSENHFHHYKLEGEQLVLVRKIEKEFRTPQNLIYVFGEKENGFWYFSPDDDKLYRMDIETGKRTAYEMAGIKFPRNHKTAALSFMGKLYQFENNYYLTLLYRGENRSVLLKLEKESNQFRLVEGLPTNAQNIQLFNDDSGNLVYVFKYSKEAYKAILEDKKGLRYDYSAFLPSSLMAGNNLSLNSPDFKQQLLVCHPQGILLQTVKVSGVINHILRDIPIRAMVELPGQQTLIKTQTQKHYFYENRTDQMESWENPACKMSWAKLLKDKDGFIWGHTNKAIVKYDPVNDTCEKYSIAITNKIMALVGNDRIAFINRDQLAFFDLKNKEVIPFLIDGEPLTITGYIHDMLYSRSGLLWIATTKGMIKVDLEHKTSAAIGLNEPFLDFRFLCIHEDEKGWLWLGTPLGGIHIYNPVNGELKILNSDNGLANNTVAYIVADDDGDLWAGTYNGVSIISPDGELIANIYEKDGLVEREANRYAYLKTSDGRLFLGTVNGLNIIEPRKVKQRFSGNKDLNIYLTSISYFDDNKDSTVSKQYGLGDLDRLTIPASRRNLQLKFAVSNYFKPEFNQYAYQLEGISEDWISIGTQNSLKLNNMPAGRYRLLIRGSDGTGNWTTKPLAIRIYAKEYFYKQIWFYLLCLALLVLIAFLWIFRLRSAVRKATITILEDKAIIEQQAEKLLELDLAKSRFFTNISHEFRTPLTIISGMMDQIREKPDLWLEKGTKMVKQNTVGLLNLINQILDLRKLESNELKVEMVQGDVVKYLYYITQSYESFADSKGIQLHFITAQKEIKMDYDPDKLLRIVSNLLSNAVKYTPEGGNIYFNLDKKIESEKPMLYFRVQDTGMGIHLRI